MSYFDQRESLEQENLEEKIQEQYGKLVALYGDASTPLTKEYMQSYQLFDDMMKKYLYSVLENSGTVEQFQQYQDDPAKLDCYFAMLLIKKSIPLKALREKTQETLQETLLGAVTSEGPLSVETKSSSEPSLLPLVKKTDVEKPSVKKIGSVARKNPPLEERKAQWLETMLYILGVKENPDKGIVRIDTYLQDLSDKGIRIEKWDFLNSADNDVMIARHVYRYYLRTIIPASYGMIANMFTQYDSLVNTGINRVKRLLGGGDSSIEPYLKVLGLEEEIKTLENNHARCIEAGESTNLLQQRNYRTKGKKQRYGDETATLNLSFIISRRYLMQLFWLSGGEMNISENDFWNTVQNDSDVQDNSLVCLAQQMFWYYLQLKGKKVNYSVDSVALSFHVNTTTILDGIERIKEFIRTKDKCIQRYLPLLSTIDISDKR